MNKEEEELRKHLFELLDASYEFGCMTGVFDYVVCDIYNPIDPDIKQSGEMHRAILKLQHACKCVSIYKGRQRVNEIKFRAWDKRFSMMRYKLTDGYRLSLRGNIEVLDPYGKTIRVSDDFEIMQCSGLKDSKEEDIYEGDIVYLSGIGDTKISFPFIDLYESEMEGGVGEIVGNIFDC